MGHTARNVAPPVRDAAAASDRVLPPGRGLSRSASSVRSSPSGWDDVWRRVYDEQLHPIWGRGWYCWKCMRLRRPRTTHETGGPDGSGAGPLPDERSPLIASAVGPLPLAITGLACAPSSGTHACRGRGARGFRREAHCAPLQTVRLAHRRPRPPTTLTATRGHRAMSSSSAETSSRREDVSPPLRRPQCSACRRPVRYRIHLYGHAAGMERVARLCGQHARPVRAMNRVNSAFTVLEVAELHYVRRWT
jgi:hypothetical protein